MNDLESRLASQEEWRKQIEADVERWRLRGEQPLPWFHPEEPAIVEAESFDPGTEEYTGAIIDSQGNKKPYSIGSVKFKVPNEIAPGSSIGKQFATTMTDYGGERVAISEIGSNQCIRQVHITSTRWGTSDRIGPPAYSYSYTAGAALSRAGTDETGGNEDTYRYNADFDLSSIPAGTLGLIKVVLRFKADERDFATAAFINTALNTAMDIGFTGGAIPTGSATKGFAESEVIPGTSSAKKFTVRDFGISPAPSGDQFYVDVAFELNTVGDLNAISAYFGSTCSAAINYFETAMGMADHSYTFLDFVKTSAPELLLYFWHPGAESDPACWAQIFNSTTKYRSILSARPPLDFNRNSGEFGVHGLPGYGTAGQVPKVNAGADAMEWYTPAGATAPGGNDTYVQYNDGGAFGGDDNFTWDKNAQAMLIDGTLIDLSGDVSIDPINRILYDGIPAISLDWANRMLSDSSENVSLDWENRQAFGSAGWTAIDWENSTLSESDALSLDWDNRKLYDSAGSEIFSWLDEIKVGGVYTLPLADGDPNDILTTDGLGAATWQPAAGFANPMGAVGDIIYGDAAGAPTARTGNTATSNLFLRSRGAGGLATPPTWEAVAAADVGAPALVSPSVVGNFVSFSGITGAQADSGSKAADFAIAAHTHSGVYEPVLGNPAVTGYCLVSTDLGVRSWVVLPAAGGAHDIFSATHPDTTGAASPVDGDLIIGNVTPRWSKLAITIPAGADLLNVLGVVNGELRPSWKVLFDSTNPAALGAASPGSGVIAAHRNHVHAMPSAGDVGAQASDADLTAIAGIATARGMIIRGSAAGAWEGLALGGITGSVIARNATDTLWTTYALAGTAAQTYTFPTASDTVGCLGTAQVWTGANRFNTSGVGINSVAGAVGTLTAASTIYSSLVAASGPAFSATAGYASLQSLLTNNAAGSTQWNMQVGGATKFYIYVNASNGYEIQNGSSVILFSLASAGQLSLPVTGSAAGILIGTAIACSIYQNASAQLRTASSWQIDGGVGLNISNTVVGSLKGVTATDGANILEVASALTASSATLLTLKHSTSGTAAAAFGVNVFTQAEDDGGTNRTSAGLRFRWTSAVAASFGAEFSIQMASVGAGANTKSHGPFQIISTDQADVFNMSLLAQNAAGSYGSGKGVVFLRDANTECSVQPTTGFCLQSISGRAKIMEDASRFIVQAPDTGAAGAIAVAGYRNVVINGTTYKMLYG